MALKLFMYSTSGCHLCEDAENLFIEISSDFQLKIIDIAEDDYLLEEYGIRIPVLKREDIGTELSWPFDTEKLKGFLTN